MITHKIIITEKSCKPVIVTVFKAETNKEMWCRAFTSSANSYIHQNKEKIWESDSFKNFDKYFMADDKMAEQKDMKFFIGSPFLGLKKTLADVEEFVEDMNKSFRGIRKYELIINKSKKKYENPKF